MSSLVPGSQPRRSTRATRDAPAYVRILPNRRADARAVQEEVLLQEELTNSREVDLNDVADEVEVEEEVYPSYSGDMSTGRRVLAPAKVLLTEERLQSEPVLYAPLGRRPNRKRPIKVDNDGPPELEVQDGKLASSSVNNLRPHFQMYASAQMKKVEAGLQEMAEIAKRERMDHIQQDERQLRLQRELNVDQYVMTEGGDEETEEMESLEEACDIILGIRRVPAAKMCTTVPQGYRGEGTFIIDLRGFTNRHDVGLDGLGSWGKPMGRTRFFTMEDDRAVRADDGHGHLLTPSYTFKVMSKRYEHPQTTAADEGRSKFIRKIVTGNLSPERREAVAIAVLTYEWVGEPFDFTVSNTAVRPRRATDVPQCGSKSWEAASFNAPSTGLSAGVSLETPLFATGAVDFGAAASIILGGEHIEFNKVCCRVPQSYRENGTFIVDVRNLSNDSELRRDGNGVWGKPAGNSRYYKYDPATGDAVRVDRGNKLIEGADYDIQILAKRYEHPSVGGRFVRKIYTARTPSGESAIMTTTLAVITYYWKGAPEHFMAGPQRRILTKPRSDVLVEANVHEEDQPGPSGNAKRTRPNGGAEATMADEATLKTLVLRKSLENQERFAANLDRIEAFLDRFERAGDVFLDQIWAATAGQRPEAEVLIDEGVVGEQPVPEVYAQDYIVR